MKKYGKPEHEKGGPDSTSVDLAKASQQLTGSNQDAVSAAGLEPEEEKKGSWLSRAWSGLKSFGSAAKEGAKNGAVNGAMIGAVPGLAVGGAIGGAAGSLDSDESAVKGAGIGGGILALPGALLGAAAGALIGMADRGIDELRTDEKALLAKTANIPGYHVMLEQLAHTYAYGKGDAKTLEGWGYELNAEHEDKNSGLRVVGFKPKDPSATDPDGKPLKPVVAFRGTANGGGALDDANDQGIGTFQFSRNEKEIEMVFARQGGASDVTGHSLGGALAQLAASRLGGFVGNIVTFQSPGINGAEAQRVDSEKHKATHYRAEGDLVSDSGEGFAKGEVFTFERKGLNSPLSHMTFPLAELNALRAKHDMNLPIVSGARSSDDTWEREEGADFHEGHWADKKVQTQSRLMDVEHSADAQEAPTSAITSVLGAAMGGGRKMAESVRKTVGGMSGMADRQSGYAAAWREIRGVVRNITSPDQIPAARAQVVDLVIRYEVEPRDHGKFISQAEAAMLTALENSPKNVGGPAIA
ncbi:MAG: alpha/beta hydrolase [Myxococcota bacterium]